MEIYIKKDKKLYKWNKNKFKRNIKKALCYVSTYILFEIAFISLCIYIFNNCITIVNN